MEAEDYGSLLRKEWEQVYSSKDAKLIMRGSIQGLKVKKIGEKYIVLNSSFANSREHSINLKQKSVFINFDSDKFNFTKVSNRQILFHINLDEQEIITKENAHKITQKFFQEEEDEAQIQGHVHPVLIQIAPLCRYHSILSMYPEEQLPQVVGSDIILLLLNIFKLLPGIRIGYNSIGGSATINHLHFHLIYPQNLIGEKIFPIEKQKRIPWLKSSLINPQQQINLYSVGITIDTITADNIFGFVLTPLKPKDQQIDNSQAANSMSFVFGILINEMIQLSIPHNILIADEGMTIYIFARDFSTGSESWLEMSGVLVTTQEKEYQSATIQLLPQKLKRIKIDEKLIEITKANVKKNLSKFL